MKLKNRCWKKGTINEENVLLRLSEYVYSCKNPKCDNRYIKKKKNKIIKYCPKCRNGNYKN